MKRVLIDARWITPPRTGVGNYCLNLLSEYCRSGKAVTLIVNKGTSLDSFPDGTDFLKTSIRVDSHPLTELFEQIVIPLICLVKGYSKFVSMEGRVPVIHIHFRTYSYIYDLTTFTVGHSHNVLYTWLMRYNLTISRLTADGIITISETVKKQIAGRFNYPEERICVIYPADSQLVPSTSPEQELPMEGKYILCTGVTNPRKNLEFLLKAFENHRNTNSESKLVITGNRELINQMIFEKEAQGIINRGFVDNSELAALYQGAACLVFPSKEEGFGIPLVDAVKLGCPVLCSDIEVFREVMGDGDGYFSLTQSDELTELLNRVWKGESISFKIPREYSWQASGKKLVEHLK